MKKRQISVVLIALIAVALAAVACGKKSATPTEVAKALFDAQMKKDGAAMKKLLSKSSLKAAEEAAQKRGITLEQLLTGKTPTAMPECRDEKIDGDTATVTCTGGGIPERPMPFVKEDGEWKFEGK